MTTTLETGQLDTESEQTPRQRAPYEIETYVQDAELEDPRVQALADFSDLCSAQFPNRDIKDVYSVDHIQETIRKGKNGMRGYIRAYDEVNQLAGAVTCAGKPEPESQDERRERWITQIVEPHLVANLFMVAFIRASKCSVVFDRPKLLPLFDRLEKSSERNVPRSFRVEAIYRAASWWVSDNRGERKRLHRRLDQHFLGNAIEDNSIMPYDGARFVFLKELPKCIRPLCA